MERGAAFAQIGHGNRPSRRFDSWYDDRLVTEHGEDILRDLDTFAIQELRRLKLIWQAWGPMVSLCTPDTDFLPGSPNGMRRVIFHEPGKMRLFFLSLLWRAAASNRTEFKGINLRPSDYRRLRACVRDSALPDNWAFFPVTLTQISTRGMHHIHSPMMQVKRSIKVDGYRSGSHLITRFFLDGLVVHVHHPIEHRYIDGLWPMMVGPPEGTTVSTVTWEGSSQLLDLSAAVDEAQRLHPGGLDLVGSAATTTLALVLNTPHHLGRR